jgi:hypothetical protein
MKGGVIIKQQMHMYGCMYVCVYLYVRMYVCMFVCMYVWTYLYTGGETSVIGVFMNEKRA